MPDLTTVMFAECAQIYNFSVKYESDSSPGKWHQVIIDPTTFDFKCTCQGFAWRKKCWHIREAAKQRCTWSSFIDGGDREATKCPRCDGDVVHKPYGV